MRSRIGALALPVVMVALLGACSQPFNGAARGPTVDTLVSEVETLLGQVDALSEKVDALSAKADELDIKLDDVCLLVRPDPSFRPNPCAP